MKIYTKSIYTILIAFLGFLLNLISTIIIARWLHAEKYGDFSVVLSVVSLACIIALLGRDRIALHHLPIFYQQKKFGLIKGYIIFNTEISFLTSVLFAVIGFIIWFTFYHFTTSLFIHALLLALPLLPLMSAVNYLGNVLVATSFAFTSYIFFEIALPLILILSILIFRFSLHDINEYEALYATNLTWIFILACFLFFMKYKIMLPLKNYPSHYHHRDWLWAGLPFLISNLSLMALQEIIIIILEVYNIPEEKIGIYAAVDHVSYVIILTSIMIIEVMLPPIFRLLNKFHFPILRKYLRALFYFNIALSIIFITTISIFGKTILHWFGSGFSPGYMLLIFMSCGYVFNLLFGISIPLVQFAKLHRIVHIGYLCMFIMSISLCFILIPSLNIYGGAIAVIVPYNIMLIFMTLIVRKKMGINLWG